MSQKSNKMPPIDSQPPSNLAPKIRALCGCNSHARLVGCGWHISSATPQPFHRTVKSKDKWICFQHLKSPRNRMLPCFHAKKKNTQKTIKTHIRHKNTTRKPIILGTDLQALKIAEVNQNISPTSKIPPSRHLRPGAVFFCIARRPSPSPSQFRAMSPE